MSLDLVGLPPTLAEMDAFLADTRPDAYEKVVDRLLASPHYGERWARPWLDLARYADTNGYEKDRRRAIVEVPRLGHRRPQPRHAVRRVHDRADRRRHAPGRHRRSRRSPPASTATRMLNQEGGIDVEEARWETLVDRVNTTATVWLGSTVGCAQCHNHKFDPFSQKDYYRMLAFFDNADYRVQGLGEVVRDKWIVEPELELPTPEAKGATRARLEADRAARRRSTRAT